MEEMGKVEDVTQPIPEKLRIAGAGSDLYAIGLSLYKFDSAKRTAIHNPFFIFTVTFIYFIRQLVSMLVMTDSTDRDYLLIGDYAHFLKARYHINLFLNFGFFIPLASQVIHFLDHYQNPDKPSYLVPFEMMVGMRSPLSIGLTKMSDVHQLMAKTLFHLKYLTRLWITFPLCGIAFSSILVLESQTWFDLFFISLPWIFCFHLFVPYILGTIYMYQWVYFRIICLYLELKLRVLNKDIREFFDVTKGLRSRQMLKLWSVLHRIDSIHKEIQSINDSVWDKFLFVFIVANIAVGNFSFYVYIYVDIAVVVKIAFLYCTVLWFSMLLTLLNNVSAILLTIKKSRKYLLSYPAQHNNNLPVTLKLKIESMAEKMSKNKIGFYCYDFFILSYFNVYQIIVFTVCAFLKLLED